MTNDRGRIAPPGYGDAATLRKVAAEIEQAYPLVIRRTGLVLFDVNPDQLQAQWQVEPGHLERVRSVFPVGAADILPQLRLLRLDAPEDQRQEAVLSPPIEDGDIDGTARFSVSDYGSTYQAELGLANGVGGWLLLARSNRVQLPRPVGHPIPPREQAAAPPVPVGQPPSMVKASIGSGREFVPDIEEAPRPGNEAGSPPVADGPIPPFDPTLADTGVRPPPVFPQPVPQSGWSPSTELRRVIGLLDAVVPEIEAIPLPISSRPASGPWSDAASAQRKAGWTLAELPPPILPSSLPVEVDVPGGLPVFPSFDPDNANSSGNRLTGATAQSDVEIHAELLVYGRANPGSALRIFGQSLSVGANGHFFMRRSLDETLPSERIFSGSPAGDPGEPEKE